MPRTELIDAYTKTEYDPLRATDLLNDEVQQRRETGHDVDDVVEQANVTDPCDRSAVLALVDALAGAPQDPSWRYVEPDDLPGITTSLAATPAPRAVDGASVADKIYAAWLGRVAGCNLGKPVEIGWVWNPTTLRRYLELAGAYPLRDYIPVLDPMPDGLWFRDNWVNTTRGNVDGSDRDDDIDYTILGLHLLETRGRDLRPEHVAGAWTSLFPITQVYTAERAAYVNLVNGLSGPEVARYRNPYREWIGAQIRGDVFGYTNPGDPWAAARLSYQDASLSHVANGVYGEMWAAALCASAFEGGTARQTVERSLQVVPPRSRLHEAVTYVLGLRDRGLDWDASLQAVHARFGQYAWVHTINNAALVAAALLWGEDWTDAVGKVVVGGWDTDSNGATVGSVMGILVGTEGLPAHFVEPLHDRTRSALFGFDGSAISDLADRTCALVGTL